MTFDELEKKGWEEVSSGVYLYTRWFAQEEQRGYGDEDLAKDFDFSASDFWLITDNGVIEALSEAEADEALGGYDD